MSEIKYNYDREADVLYVSFGRSEHVTGVELADNILLRLDTGKATEEPPRAVGLTFISFARMMEYHRDRPLTIELPSPKSSACGLSASTAPSGPSLRCSKAQESQEGGG